MEIQKFQHDIYNDRFFDLVFDKKENGYFVELGAYQGVHISQTYFLEKTRKWDGVLVEPNPNWIDDLNKHRNCKIVTNPVYDKEEYVDFIIYNKNSATSKICNQNDLVEDDCEKLKLKSITLSKLLEDSPQEIDVLCIDIEGSELAVLKEYFTNSNKKINLISLECGDTHAVLDFFYDKPYVKIKNPYLNFLRIDRTNQKIVEYSSGDFYYFDGGKYDGNILDLSIINWEYYFIHLDMLSKYPSLKKLIEPIDYLKLNS